jgi:hypothetical protein
MVRGRDERGRLSLRKGEGRVRVYLGGLVFQVLNP